MSCPFSLLIVSGTRALFTELALGGKEEASNKSLETDDSGTLMQSVAQTKGSIGYVALSYLCLLYTSRHCIR